MFVNRRQAGELLARTLRQYYRDEYALIYGIVRGGVIVGGEVALRLQLPLVPLVIRKVSSPHDPELALGAVGSGGISYINRHLVTKLHVSEKYIVSERERKREEVERRVSVFPPSLKPPYSAYKTYIVVDDGVATGATVMAAFRVLNAMKPDASILLAVPVIAQSVLPELQSVFVKVLVLDTPKYFGAVGQFYKEFPQVEDGTVIDVLKRVEGK
jgi:putative phosphoribosyl transferase